jgi:cysteine synthase B
MIKTKTETALIQKVNQLGKFVGNTPLFPINGFGLPSTVKLYAKLEWMQLGGSVKSRPAYHIIKEAIQEHSIDSERTLLDASSGNTAIAYASISSALGIPVTICLPENASNERKKILNGLGAEIVYTSKFGSTDEAQDKARELSLEYPDRFYYADQYNNKNNWRAHFNTTAGEIWSETNGTVTHFVAGLGTTGTFTGTGRGLKEKNPSIKLVGLQPDNAMHGLEGWKHLETAKTPGIYDPEMIEEMLLIDTFQAFEMIKTAASKTGLLISPSAAANLFGALQVAQHLDEGVVVTVFPDNLEKYAELMKLLF